MIILALKLSISALNQRCNALKKSQILSRRSIIQSLKPHNNPMIKQLSLIRKTRRLQIWSRRSILSWWQHQMSVRELRHDSPRRSVGEKWLRDKRTPKDVCGEAKAKWAVFKIEGFVCKRFLPFFSTSSSFFYVRHFSRGLSLFFLVLWS